jgi:hypothetical protein
MKNDNIETGFGAKSADYERLLEISMPRNCKGAIGTEYFERKQMSNNLKTAVIEKKAGLVIITSYPPRECGIATYSQDLTKSINSQFGKSVNVLICALENGESDYNYPEEVKYKLDTTKERDFIEFCCK